MRRDNLSKEDACAEIKTTWEEIQDAITEGDSELFGYILRYY